MARILVVIALIAQTAAAQGPAPALPNRAWTPERLNRLFDGSISRPELTSATAETPKGKNKILYAESDQDLEAPRFALDLDAVPAEYRNMISGFDRLPFKNQEETKERVDEVNRKIREHNRGRLFGKIDEWTYDDRPNEPIWNCLSHAAASANDWWSQQLGRELPEHFNISRGTTDKGLDPYLLELRYFERAYDVDDEDGDFVVPPKFIQKDPVRNTGFPYEPRGYAKLLTEGEPYDVKDPISGKIYKFRPEMSAMEGEWKQLFTNSIFRDKTPLKYAKKLAKGLDKWGVAYVQLEHTEHARWPGAHAVAVVGYFCMKPGERLIHCSENKTDEDWGKNTWFIAHDSFGKFPASQARTAHSGSAYRAVRVTSIDQAIVFPHGLRVTLSPRPGVPGVWNVGVTNTGGKPVDVLRVKALVGKDVEVPVGVDAGGVRTIEGVTGASLRVYVEAKHYYAKNGRGRGFVVKLADEPRVAVPLK
jgi:hypothetical protein